MAADNARFFKGFSLMRKSRDIEEASRQAPITLVLLKHGITVLLMNDKR
jgi:hypothetical protein